MRANLAPLVIVVALTLGAGCLQGGADPSQKVDTQKTTGPVRVATSHDPAASDASGRAAVPSGAPAAGGDLLVYLVRKESYGDAWERQREASSTMAEAAAPGATLEPPAQGADSRGYRIPLDAEGATAFALDAGPGALVVRLTVTGGGAAPSGACRAYYVPAAPLAFAYEGPRDVAVPFGVRCSG